MKSRTPNIFITLGCGIMVAAMLRIWLSEWSPWLLLFFGITVIVVGIFLWNVNIPKLSPKVLWIQLKSWCFWKLYNPKLSYNITRIAPFDDNGFLGFEAKFTMVMTNKTKPLNIELNGVCLVITQDGKYVQIGNSGLGKDYLKPKEMRTWKNIIVRTLGMRILGPITNPPDLTQPYDVGVRGAYVICGKHRKELCAGVLKPSR